MPPHGGVPPGHPPPQVPLTHACPLGQQVAPHGVAPGLRQLATGPLQVLVDWLAQAVHALTSVSCG